MLLLLKFCVFFNNDFKVIWRMLSNSWNIVLVYGLEKKIIFGMNYLIIDENLC